MNEQKELVAHLMRRAGFGATKQEIESLASLKYEKIVDSLVSPCLLYTSPSPRD